MLKFVATLGLRLFCFYSLVVYGLFSTISFIFGLDMMGIDLGFWFLMPVIAHAFYIAISKSNEKYLIRRLSPCFIETKIIRSKYRRISQNLGTRTVEEGQPFDCKARFRELLKEEELLLSQLLPNVTYLAITHDAVLRRLQRAQNIEQETLRATPCGKASLLGEQQQLTEGRCKRCPHTKRESCGFHRRATDKHQFYLIRFCIKEPA